MSKFKIGDEVRITEGLLAGETGIITCAFWQKSASDYPEIIVQFDNGESSFVDYDYVEPLEDPYEYAVQVYQDEFDRWVLIGYILAYGMEPYWSTKEVVQTHLERQWELWPKRKFRMVKRRKAGRIENV